MFTTGSKKSNFKGFTAMMIESCSQNISGVATKSANGMVHVQCIKCFVLITRTE